MDTTAGTIVILLAGVFMVVGGILWLRLHAFLALTLGALLVALLTPAAAVLRYHIADAAEDVLAVDATANVVTLAGGSSAGFRPGTRYELVRSVRGTEVKSLGWLEVVETDVPGEQGKKTTVARLVEGKPLSDLVTRSGSLETGVLAIHPTALAAATKLAHKTTGARVAEGFGSTAGKIGILIAMAAIIGKCLLESGAADRIVRTTLRWFGEEGAPAAFLFSGFALGIPVFFDTVFYLMIPLGKAMRMRTGRNYLLYVLTIVCGATMAHSLVPPTPGPLFVAEELGVNLGLMILGGGLVGLWCAGFGYLYARFAARRWDLPLRESPDFSIAELEESLKVDESELPAFSIAILPILLPVLFIAGYSVLQRFGFDRNGLFMRVAACLGDKNIALTISAGIAIGTLMWQKRRALRDLGSDLQAALASGGVIILITAAGGAFGQVLRETGVAGLIADLPRLSPAMVCVMAFLITTAVRTAQGSATVAMITAVGILSGVARGGDLGFHPLYLALAIGCGSKPIAWMNDSGFWVITRMSGMTEGEGLKYVTPMTTGMGIVGIILVAVSVTLFPMV